MDARVVVDASVWVSWFIPQDVNHHASSIWIERYITEGGIMAAPTFILIEVAAAVSRHGGQFTLGREAVKDLFSVRAMDFIAPNPSLFWGAVEIATGLQLRAGDTTYVALAYQLSLPLVTWDREQLTRARSLTTTYTPDTYIF